MGGGSISIGMIPTSGDNAGEANARRRAEVGSPGVAPFGSSNCQILTASDVRNDSQVSSAEKSAEPSWLCVDHVSSSVVAGEPPAIVSFFGDGSLIEVENLVSTREDGRGRQGRDAPEVGTREAISEFTWKSQREIKRWIARLRSDARPVFVTLTLPAWLWARPDQAKEWLRVFMQDLIRLDPTEISVIWKMEPQKNGSPHFHLFVYGVAFLPWQSVAQRWTEIVLAHECSEDAPIVRGKAGAALFREWAARMAESGKVNAQWCAMVQACGRVEAVRTRNGVAFYLAKYITKGIETPGQQELWATPGRWWGIQGRENLPVSKITRVHMGQKAAGRFARVMRRWLASRMRGKRLRHVRRVFTTAHTEFLRVVIWAEGDYERRRASLSAVLSGIDPPTGEGTGG